MQIHNFARDGQADALGLYYVQRVR